MYSLENLGDFVDLRVLAANHQHCIGSSQNWLVVAMSKDKMLQTLVTKEINRRYNSGEMETIQSTFSKVPKARLIKEASPLVFDEIRHAV
jgi:hypothetical protein